MTVTTTVPTDTPVETEPVVLRPVPEKKVWSSPLMVIGLTLVGLFVLVAVLAPLLTSYDPKKVTGQVMEPPSGRHWLGTDKPGRDLFAQLVFGARTSLTVGVVGGALAVLGGILVGVLPALLGPRADTLSNRLVVFMLALPGLPLLVLIGALVGPNQVAIIIVIVSAGVAPIARVLRSQALVLRERGFISAARGFGAGPLYILRRHVVPAMGPLIVVEFVSWTAVAIGLEASLAFLGLGNPSNISWGMMMNRALGEPNIYFSQMWVWWALPPGLAITLAVLGFTFVGVALEPAFNPRWLRSA